MHSLLKIVITGPESCGKTTLTEAIAAHFDIPFVPEYAREYLSELHQNYSEYDLIEIARGQFNSEMDLANHQPTFLLCDTSLLVVKIWNEVKYGRLHPSIKTLYEFALPDLYILPHWDIPYEEDPLRESPNDRVLLYSKYLQAIEGSKIEVLEVAGSPTERLEKSVSRIKDLLDTRS